MSKPTGETHRGIEGKARSAAGYLSEIYVVTQGQMSRDLKL
jgi:hypothetical protein